MRPTSNRAGVIAVALAIMTLLFGSAAAPLSAQDWSPPRTVWVEATGHTIDGYFLDLWRTYPDLLGQPVTEEWESPIVVEGYERHDRFVQYFEYLAIVYVPEESRLDWQVQTLPSVRKPSIGTPRRSPSSRCPSPPPVVRSAQAPARRSTAPAIPCGTASSISGTNTRASA